jgi:hypothetical protein
MPEKDDPIYLKEFPLFYVRLYLKQGGGAAHIYNMFTPKGNMAILKNIASELTKQEKELMKAMFAHLPQHEVYLAYLS